MQTKARVTIIFVALLLQIAIFAAMDKWACYDCNTQRITYGLLLAGNLVVFALIFIAVRESSAQIPLWVKAPLVVLSLVTGLSATAFLMWFALPILRYQ